MSIAGQCHYQANSSTRYESAGEPLPEEQLHRRIEPTVAIEPTVSIEPSMSMVKTLDAGEVPPIGLQNATEGLKTEDLQEAFALFNRISTELTESNYSLQNQLRCLENQLTEVDQQRLKELADKEHLADRLENLLAVLPAGVIVLDGKGRVQQSNPTAEALLPCELQGRQWVEVIRTCFQPRIDDGHEVSLKDGRRIGIATRSVNDNAGQIIVLNDLTETRNLQARIERHRRLWELGKTAASLAHQIRTPLSSAMLYASQLGEPTLAADKQRVFQQRLMMSLSHLEQQVKDMLMFARAEIPMGQTVSLSVLMDELKCAVQGALQRVDADIIFPESIPACQLRCNKDALIGSIANVIHNALEALGLNRPQCDVTAAGRVVIEAELTDRGLEITVTDNGPGIPPTVADKIFEPFYSTKENGTGLGLAVAKTVARVHGASLTLHCLAAGGTQFAWLFPPDRYTRLSTKPTPHGCEVKDAEERATE